MSTEVQRDYYADGQVRQEWYIQEGKWHRLDGPAYIWYYADGQVHQEGYCQEGKHHRLDGPAVIRYYKDGQVQGEKYYKNGIEVPQEAFVGFTPGTKEFEFQMGMI